MKTIIIGDIHGLNTWKNIVQQEQVPCRIIFMGDYFDSFNILGIDQIYNFNEIINFKKESQHEVILLIGNHDHHYLDVGEIYSGYQHHLQWDIKDAIRSNIMHLQIAYQLENLIFSHAGLSPIWLNRIFGENEWEPITAVTQVNERYLSRPRDFNFASGTMSPTGDSIEQGPLWIRPRSLMKSNNLEEINFKNDFIQIVGHTCQPSIHDSFISSQKTMGNKYYIVDTLPSGGYVVYENGELIPKQYNP
jgi:hypothetical protein